VFVVGFGRAVSSASCVRASVIACLRSRVAKLCTGLGLWRFDLKRVQEIRSERPRFLIRTQIGEGNR
jgi:hypothetical protein